MQRSVLKQFDSQIKSLVAYADILSSNSRSSVSISHLNYEVKVIGKEILSQSDRESLNLVYTLIDDNNLVILDEVYLNIQMHLMA